MTASRRALILGAASGLRTFGALGPLGARGRLGGRAGRIALPALMLGEMAGDKHPAIPPRGDPAPVVGRLAAGALAGRIVAGAPGTGAGAAGAAATTWLSERARATLGRRTGVPDPLLGAAEDLLAVALGSAASRDDPSQATQPAAEPAGRRPPAGPAAAARGLLAAAAGTAAMTTVQTAYLRATGTGAGDAPERMGRRIIGAMLHRRVPHRHRPALNQGMHLLYGTSWGLPFGLVAGMRRARTSTGAGMALGALVWTVGLAALAALELAPAPWEQSPASLATDLAFHLAYGAATGAAYGAL